jgi:hypothetical protein
MSLGGKGLNTALLLELRVSATWGACGSIINEGCSADTLGSLFMFMSVVRNGLVRVVARSKSWVCGRLLAGNVGSNPAGVIDVCFEWCVLSGRGSATGCSLV